MTELPIRASGLTKTFGGRHGDPVLALVDLDLAVEAGEVFGFLGPNGAGKTTAIRTFLNFLRPTRGQAEIFGLAAQHDSVAIRRHVGYVPGEFEMYPKLTGAEVLRYFANLRGGVDEHYVAELADRLDADLGKAMRDYSTGNRQKICLIQAFMNRPDLLILDEPSTGLDPLMQKELQSMIAEVRDEGRTVFLSSHSLSEVQHVADRVGILRAGRLIEVARVAELMHMAVRQLEFDFAESVPDQAFAQIAHVQRVEASGSVTRVWFDGPISDLLRVALAHDVLDVKSHEADLEEIFLTYYREPGDPADTSGVDGVEAPIGADQS